jgi:ABC-type transport system involved in Fe-S cluster assembly fused permease/ATPase subunit
MDAFTYFINNFDLFFQLSLFFGFSMIYARFIYKSKIFICISSRNLANSLQFHLSRSREKIIRVMRNPKWFYCAKYNNSFPSNILWQIVSSVLDLIYLFIYLWNISKILFMLSYLIICILAEKNMKSTHILQWTALLCQQSSNFGICRIFEDYWA